MGNYITDNMVQLLGDKVNINNDLKTSINLAISEMAQLYGEQQPYEFINKELTEVKFNNNFIDKLIYVMATDKTEVLNEKELIVWNEFIKYQDSLLSNEIVTIQLEERFMDIYNNIDKRTLEVIFRDLIDISKEKFDA